MDAFCLLPLGESAIFASTIHLAHNAHKTSKVLNAIDVFRNLSSPLGSVRINRGTVVFTNCTNFCKAVDERTRTGGRSENGQPDSHMLLPRPHTDPARRRSVAWDPSLSVASSGANMDPVYPRTDKAYILKSTLSLD